MEVFGKAVGWTVLVLLSILLTAFTVSTLWGWFVVPLGVKSIGLAHAYGLSLVVTCFMSVRGIPNDTKRGEVLGMGVVLNLLCLLFGYIAVQFI